MSRWGLLGVILVVAAGYWVLEYQPYVLPNSDFFRIHEMTVQIAKLQVPDDFKQMPLVPILILPLAAALGGVSDAHLHALSILNIALSLGSLVLLYLLARVFVGGTLALVPVVLLLAAPQFTVSTHQPMLEPTIGFFALATLLALACRSRWALALAGLAALTRYELSVLLVVVFAVQTMRSPAAWFGNGVRAALAGLPFVVWFGLSVVLPAEGNSYIDEIVRASPLAVAANLLTPFPSREFMLLFVALGWSLGLLAAWRKDREATTGIVLFFGLYLLAHFVYGRPLSRYGYTVLWVVPLLATVGVRALFGWLEPWVRRSPSWLIVAVALTTGAAATAVWLRAAVTVSRRMPSAAINTDAWYIGSSTLWLAVVLVAVALATRGRFWRKVLTTSVVAVLVVTPVVLGGGTLSQGMTGVYYDKAELVAVLEWLALNTEADAVVVMPRFHALRDDMPTIEADRVVRYSSFSAETHEGLVDELAARNIEYVVFLHRPERPTDESSPLYGRNLENYLRAKVYLMDPFRSGEAVAGFERLVTLGPPHPTHGHPTHVYRMSEPLDGKEVRQDD